MRTASNMAAARVAATQARRRERRGGAAVRGRCAFRDAGTRRVGAGVGPRAVIGATLARESRGLRVALAATVHPCPLMRQSALDALCPGGRLQRRAPALGMVRECSSRRGLP